jgi:hypothetical protein
LLLRNAARTDIRARIPGDRLRDLRNDGCMEGPDPLRAPRALDDARTVAAVLSTARRQAPGLVAIAEFLDDPDLALQIAGLLRRLR